MAECDGTSTFLFNSTHTHLSVFAVAVEAAIQEAQSLLQQVFVLRHHAISHHPLLARQPLVLVTAETLQPHRPSDQFFRVGFKIT